MNEKEEIVRGEALLQKGQIGDALNIFDCILNESADNVDARNDKGVALNRLGRYKDAVKEFRKVLEIDKTHAQAAFNLVSNVVSLGWWSEADACVTRYGHLLSGKDVGVLKKEIGRIRDEQDNAGLTKIENSAHELNLLATKASNVMAKNMFFIIGIPKSGTTWLQYILNGHPEIKCSGENHFGRFIEAIQTAVKQYNDYIIDCNRNIGTSTFGFFNTQDLGYFLTSSLGLLLGNAGIEREAKVVGSKDPLLLKKIDECSRLFPAAKFIHIIRDGRDVVTSAWFNNLRANREDTLRRWSDFRSFVEFGVHQWASDIGKGLAFGKKEPGRYLEVKYESLHQNPHKNVERIVEFLGVDASEEVLTACVDAGSFKTLSRGRKQGEEDRSAFFRKGSMGDWKNHFDGPSVATFVQHGGELLQALGYG